MVLFVLKNVGIGLVKRILRKGRAVVMVEKEVTDRKFRRLGFVKVKIDGMKVFYVAKVR